MSRQPQKRSIGHRHKKPESSENQERMTTKSSIIVRKLDLLEKTINLIVSRLNEQEKAVYDLMESHGLLWACGSLDFSEGDITRSERKERGERKK